ncbi:MAG TPA: NAD(P)H-hydrate dehydratase [Verrucomicrobiae bacterium]|nr:NAD(P)H-hydrate dehydratase [Verrucomicrobiae bacterium]
MPPAQELSQTSPDPLSPRALLTTAEMQRADQLAAARGVPSWTLMQAAGNAVAREARLRWDRPTTLVLCGPGNNGGDGFVAAEALRRAGWPVRVALLGKVSKLKGDAALAAAAWGGPVEDLTPNLDGAGLIIDALFGAGLARPLDGIAAAAVAVINERKLPCLSIDLPSGVNGDTGQVLAQAPQALVTVTFFRRKAGHLLYPGRALSGELVVADIGIPADVLTEIGPRQFENHPELWRHELRPPLWSDHKYTRGSLLIAGGDEMTGAVRLAARAARRLGVGLVTVACSSAAHPIYALDSPGAVTRIADSDAEFADLVGEVRRSAFLIGPGYGNGRRTRGRALDILRTGKPAVLDADALSSFAANPAELRDALHAGVVLTPHEGEFARVFPGIGPSPGKVARVRAAALAARATIVLKGPDTVIAAPDGLAVVNSNAPPSLAMAGSGDVLAGLIAGLMALGMRPFLAAAAGVWLQGRAATLVGEFPLIEDINDSIRTVLLEISSS